MSLVINSSKNSSDESSSYLVEEEDQMNHDLLLTANSSMRRAVSSNTLKILNQAAVHEEKHHSSQIENHSTKKIKHRVNFLLDIVILFAILALCYQPQGVVDMIRYSPDISFASLRLAYESWIRLDNYVACVSCTMMLSLTLILLFKTYWIGWLIYSVLRSVGLWLIVIYQLLRIILSLTALALIRGQESLVHKVYLYFLNLKNQRATVLRDRLSNAKEYFEWLEIAEKVDLIEGKEEWKKSLSSDDNFDFISLRKNTEQLVNALEARNPEEIAFLLSGFLKRNKLGIDSPHLHLQCLNGTKDIIELYNRKVIQALEYLCDTKDFEHNEKLRFFCNLKRSFGSTALCLSGGGSIGMYHIGVIKVLLENNLLPSVISGSSGGSITAAMLACKTNQELLDDIIQDNISTRFKDINWFPPLFEQIIHFITTGCLMSNERFVKTTRQYYGEPFNALEKTKYYTFRDAYEKTGRHVSITVSASDITDSKGPRKLLLNHIHTPDVFLWSAVAVSCSLPGIMKAKQLYCRDVNGETVPYLSLGQEWIDGSVRHDLPFDAISTCFNSTNFIVSQVNPHVVPFLSKEIDAPRSRNSFTKTLESVTTMDIRHRLTMLAKVGLVPKVYGQQLGKYFKQKFSGHVTIIPNFILQEAIGLKAILNPTVEDMQRYILGGQRAVWPKLSYIRHLCEIEKCLDQCLSILEIGDLKRYQNWLDPSEKHRNQSQ